MTVAAFARLFLYVGAMLAIGEAFVAWRPRTLLGWIAALFAVLTLLLLQALDMELDPTADAWGALLTGTTWGRHWCLLAGAVGAGTLAHVLRAPRGVAMAAAVAVAVAMGGLGHAAADEGFPVLIRVVDAAHLLATGIWIGGLGLIAVRGLGAARGDAAADAPTWSAFSARATVAAPIAVLTGLIAGWRRVTAVQSDDAGQLTLPSVTTLLTAEYGQLLLVKLGLVLIMLGLGAMHRRRVLKEHAPSKAAIGVELLLAAVVLAVTGVLTGTAPPGE
jgi:putative copper export protein